MKTQQRETETADTNSANSSHYVAPSASPVTSSTSQATSETLVSDVSDAARHDARLHIASLDSLADEAAGHGNHTEAATESAEPDSPAAQYAARYLASLSEIAADRLSLQPAFVPHDDDLYHVRDLLRYHDSDFVAAAYRAILKRQPEMEEVTEATDALRTNRFTKDDLLASLSNSEEGREANVKLEGVQSPFVRRVRRQPAFGFILQVLKGLFNVPRLIRDQQRFEAYTVGQQQLVVEHMNRLTHKLTQSETLAAAALAELAQSAADTGETLLMMTDTLAGVAVRQHEWQETARRVVMQQQDLARASAALNSLRSELEDQWQEMQRQRAEIGAQRKEIDARRDALREELAQHQNDLAQFRSDQNTELARLRSRVKETIGEEVDRHQNYMAQLTSDQNTELARLRLRIKETIDAQDEFLIQEQAVIVETQKLALARMQQQLTDLIAQHARTQQALIEQQRNLQNSTAREAVLTDAPAARNSSLAIPFFDEMYAAFEDRFRGSREMITERLREYLPRVHELREGFGADKVLPVLDVGCGRGEWLELLREAGFAARGVDSNRVTSAECLARALDVTHADVIAHLRGLASDSVSLITGFHLIEHLPLDVLVELLDESLRVLAPGGKAIFETPNPKNLVVAACNFYSDPTHQSPVFPETIQFLLEHRGFVRVELEYMHTAPENPFTEADRASEVLRGFLYGPLDYAVIGMKPA